jgi:hypothetical protein
VAARLGRDAKVVIGEAGTTKSVAASFYLKLAQQLEEKLDEDLSIAKTLESEGPHEEIDAIDYDVTRFGEDRSEYIGDPTA